MTTKTCTKCRQEQPVCNFGKQLRGRGGLRARCRDCVNAWKRAYASSNPEYREKVQEAGRLHRAKNKERWKERDCNNKDGKAAEECTMTRACTKCKQELPMCNFGKNSNTRDGLHSWCRACASAAKRVLYANDPEHREKVREQGRRWYIENRDIAKARVKKYHEENKDKVRDYLLKKKFGISLADYHMMLAAQGGKCAMCERRKPTRGHRTFDVDHCHRTGEIRGLLCSLCNAGLGCFQDDPQLLQAGIKYLANPPARKVRSRPNTTISLGRIRA